MLLVSALEVLRGKGVMHVLRCNVAQTAQIHSSELILKRHCQAILAVCHLGYAHRAGRIFAIKRLKSSAIASEARSRPLIKHWTIAVSFGKGFTPLQP